MKKRKTILSKMMEFDLMMGFHLIIVFDIMMGFHLMMVFHLMMGFHLMKKRKTILSDRIKAYL